MTKSKQKKLTTIPMNLIAPCGINCRVCWGFIRETNSCPGCLSMGGGQTQKAKSRTECKIKNCPHLAKSEVKYCSDKCTFFPCVRLKQMDKRYRAKYALSLIDNLQMIRQAGIREFVRNEKTKWACPQCGELICVHKPVCVGCGHKRGTNL